jgi:DNA-binding transcriptional regulator YhcF (GntR family)
VICEVDTGSPVPPYEQIRAQLAELISSGALPDGARLPAIRQLAGDLGLAPGTVARAYRELEASGLVLSRVRHGTTVAARSRPTAAQTRDRLAEAARSYAGVVRALGLTRDQAIAAASAALDHPAG